MSSLIGSNLVHMRWQIENGPSADVATTKEPIHQKPRHDGEDHYAISHHRHTNLTYGIRTIFYIKQNLIILLQNILNS